MFSERKYDFNGKMYNHRKTFESINVRENRRGNRRHMKKKIKTDGIRHKNKQTKNSKSIQHGTLKR